MKLAKTDISVPKRYFSVQEAADYLRVSRSTINRLLVAGEIPSARVCDGGKIIIAIEDLDSWFKRHRCFMSFMVDCSSLPSFL